MPAEVAVFEVVLLHFILFQLKKKYFMVSRHSNVVTKLSLPGIKGTEHRWIPCNVLISTRVALRHRVGTETELFSIPGEKWTSINPPGKVYLFQLKSVIEAMGLHLLISWEPKSAKKQLGIPTTCSKMKIFKNIMHLFESCLKFTVRGNRTDLLLLGNRKENQKQFLPLFSKEKLFSWVEASDMCKKLGGKLPVFTSREELTNFVNLLTYSPSITPVENYFIGLKLVVSARTEDLSSFWTFIER